MKVQDKPDYLIFAGEAKTGEIENFPDIARGWGVTIEQTQSKPPLEWMNSAFNRVDSNTLYLIQQGVPEWDKSISYPVNAVTKYNGVLYTAIIANDNATPPTSTTKWKKSIADVQDATLTQKGIVKLSSATDSASEIEAATPKAVSNILENLRALGIRSDSLPDIGTFKGLYKSNYNFYYRYNSSQPATAKTGQPDLKAYIGDNNYIDLYGTVKTYLTMYSQFEMSGFDKNGKLYSFTGIYNVNTDTVQWNANVTESTINSLALLLTGGTVPGKTNFTGGLQSGGLDTLTSNTGLSKVCSSNGSSTQRWAKIASGVVQSNQYSNLSFLVCGGNSGGSGSNQIDLITISTRGAITLKQLSLVSASLSANSSNYGYVKDGDNVEFWVKCPTWSNTPTITAISSGNSTSYMSQESSLAWQTSEPSNISYITPEVNITTANVANYAAGLGVGQTWQNMRASRSEGIVYTNNTTKPIEVSVSGATSSGTLSLYVNDVVVCATSIPVRYAAGVSGVVPPGSTYKFTGTNEIQYWAELR